MNDRGQFGDQYQMTSQFAFGRGFVYDEQIMDLEGYHITDHGMFHVGHVFAMSVRGNEFLAGPDPHG